MKLVLGATTRPWNKLPFAEACAHIAAAGYPEVAVFSSAGAIPVTAATSPEAAAAVGATARAAGLEPSLLICGVRLDVPVAEAVAEHCRLVDACAALGARWLMNCGTEDPGTYDNYRAIMRACAPYAAERGVVLNMKPHGGIGLTGRMMVETLESVDHPNFTLCYDPGNIIYYTKGERRPERDVRDVLGRVATCMVKDCVVVDGVPDVQVLPGEGLVDFEAVLGQLVAGGFTGPLYVECLGGQELADINARAVRTRDYLGRILAGLTAC